MIIRFVYSYKIVLEGSLVNYLILQLSQTPVPIRA